MTNKRFPYRQVILVAAVILMAMTLMVASRLDNGSERPKDDETLQTTLAPTETAEPVTTAPTEARETEPSTEVPETTVPSQPTETQPATTVQTEPPTTVPAETTEPEETEPPTTVQTEPPTTEPAPTESEAPNVYEYDDEKITAFVSYCFENWTCPLKADFGEITGDRVFASSRSSGKRAHAGVDFVAPKGTKVYAITSGTVRRVAEFYEGTLAVEVLNDDGSILRYCEISTSLKAGDRVEQGDVIGSIKRSNVGTEMLHMEVYYGDASGALTDVYNKTYSYVDNKNFMRRSDLMDPTFLTDLPKAE